MTLIFCVQTACHAHFGEPSQALAKFGQRKAGYSRTSPSLLCSMTTPWAIIWAAIPRNGARSRGRFLSLNSFRVLLLL